MMRFAIETLDFLIFFAFFTFFDFYITVSLMPKLRKI